MSSEPPKSQMTRLASRGGGRLVPDHQLVGAEALAPSIRQRKTAACTFRPSSSSEVPARQSGRPAGELLPEEATAQPGTSLAALGVVDGRDAGVLNCQGLALLDQPRDLSSSRGRGLHGGGGRGRAARSLVETGRTLRNGIELSHTTAGRRSRRRYRDTRPWCPRPPRGTRHTLAFTPPSSTGWPSTSKTSSSFPSSDAASRRSQLQPGPPPAQLPSCPRIAGGAAARDAVRPLEESKNASATAALHRGQPPWLGLVLGSGALDRPLPWRPPSSSPGRETTLMRSGGSPRGSAVSSNSSRPHR